MTSVRIFLDYYGPRGCSTRFKWCKIAITPTTAAQPIFVNAPPAVSPAVRNALHVLRSSKTPSDALHLVECALLRGFDSFRAHHLF